MVPPRSVTPSDWLRGQWGGVLKARLRWQEVVLVTSALRKVQLEGRKKKLTGWGDRPNLVFRGAGDKNSHLMSLTTSWWDMVDTSEPFTWRKRGAARQRGGKTKRRPSSWAGARAGHLYDSVPFLDPSLDRRAAKSDILDQLDPLPADGEAEAQLVLLHDHASLDETRTWDGHMLTISAI